MRLQGVRDVGLLGGYGAVSKLQKMGEEEAGGDGFQSKDYLHVSRIINVH